jgi:hypothetical protein
MADDDVAEGPRRRRVIEWDDPFETSRPAAGLAGIDYLRGFIDGTFPPPPMGRLTFTEGRVTDAAGNLIATATSSLLVFPLDPPTAS